MRTMLETYLILLSENFFFAFFWLFDSETLALHGSNTTSSDIFEIFYDFIWILWFFLPLLTFFYIFSCN